MIADRTYSGFAFDRVDVHTNHADITGVIWRQVGVCARLAFLVADYSTRDDALLTQLDRQGVYLGVIRSGVLHVYDWSSSTEEHDHYTLGPVESLEDASRLLLEERGFATT